jgi:hypothetical protein
MESPCEVAISLPPAWLAAGGFVGLLTALRYVLKFRPQVSADVAELEAERAEFDARRSEAELRVIEMQLLWLTRQRHLEILEAEIFDPT